MDYFVLREASELFIAPSPLRARNNFCKMDRSFRQLLLLSEESLSIRDFHSSLFRIPSLELELIHFSSTDSRSSDYSPIFRILFREANSALVLKSVPTKIKLEIFPIAK